MGQALDVLAGDSAAGLSTTLNTLLRVIGAVRWDVLDDGTRDAYFLLYEHFLQIYDPDLRIRTGRPGSPPPDRPFTASRTDRTDRTEGSVFGGQQDAERIYDDLLRASGSPTTLWLIPVEGDRLILISGGGSNPCLHRKGTAKRARQARIATG
ncbi:hypothetical protein [Streptomyces sp. NBC_01618]|uniref:hypothetical protein n=1 Tax=Streptomyces sp. NBC_01618 TaxID=2975900 RepID=UPI0038641CE2|nr:hypothetical protein OH735_17005 [Streptomyces sp. NBC_01618]